VRRASEPGGGSSDWPPGEAIVTRQCKRPSAYGDPQRWDFVWGDSYEYGVRKRDPETQ
jgi:hypothetical protein